MRAIKPSNEIDARTPCLQLDDSQFELTQNGLSLMHNFHHAKNLVLLGTAFLIILLLYKPRKISAQQDDIKKHRKAVSDGGKILHEYVSPPRNHAPGSQLNNNINKLPEGPASPGRRSPSSTYGDRLTRQQKIAPDKNTIHKGRLVYHASFNPSVVPLKRFSALDRVRVDFTLSVSESRLKRVKLRRLRGVSGRDFFWGSFYITSVENKPIPIPSVSPDMLVHKIRIRPNNYRARIYKDGADNFFLKVRREHQGFRPSGRNRDNVRVQMLVSGTRSYFGGKLPPRMLLNDYSTSLPQLPPQVLRKANIVLSHIGVRSANSLNALLHKLVAYFRAFRQGQMSMNTGNTYLDLALSQKGVCRHRSFAFVITAQAAGIPARYVQNEAHAFVEVLLPQLGWRRIDLGGASPQLDITNSKGHKPHLPPPDPFAKHRNSSSQSQSAAPSWFPWSPPGSVKTRSNVNASRRTAVPQKKTLPDLRQSTDPGTWVDAVKLGLSIPDSSAIPSLWEKRPKDPNKTKHLPTKAPPSIPSSKISPMKSVSLSPPQVKTKGIRGTPIHVSGTVSDKHGALSNHRVVILLHPPENRSAVVVGETITNANGHYELRALIPQNIPVGLYEIVTHSPSQNNHEKGNSL